MAHRDTRSHNGDHRYAIIASSHGARIPRQLGGPPSATKKSSYVRHNQTSKTNARAKKSR